LGIGHFYICLRFLSTLFIDFREKNVFLKT
jgi:hypothetical protein